MTEKLVHFLYILMRDYPGVPLNYIADEHVVQAEGKKRIYSNETVEEEARKLARRLTR